MFDSRAARPGERLLRKMPLGLTMPALALLVLAGCIAQTVHDATAAGDSKNAPADAVAAKISPDELRSVLSELARSHDQKTQLAFYERWIKNVDKPLQGFYDNMGKVQGDLLSDLKNWAKAHKVNLTFHMPTDVRGDAEKILEARQEKLVRDDNKTDFARDSLMQMYNDYEWQISMIQALLPKVQDPGLKAYLEKSLKAHQAGSDEALGLLKRFRFAG